MELFIHYMRMARPATTRVTDIVDAALDVFSSVGFSRTQMSDVAAAAGVSVGTLYNYVGFVTVTVHVGGERFSETVPVTI